MLVRDGSLKTLNNRKKEKKKGRERAAEQTDCFGCHEPDHKHAEAPLVTRMGDGQIDKRRMKEWTEHIVRSQCGP